MVRDIDSVPAKTNIEVWLRENVSFKEKLVFVPNSGNAGDSLISYTTLMMFKMLGFVFQHCAYDSKLEVGDIKNKTVVYGGGGNLVPLYSSARDFISRIHKHAQRVIILPHTIAGNEDLLEKLGSRVTIFCRELESYEHVKKYAKNAEVLLADDMVFSLQLPDLKNPLTLVGFIKRLVLNAWDSHFKSLRAIPRDTQRYLRCRKIIRMKTVSVLNAYREDKEGLKKEVPDKNIDVSELFAFGSQLPQDIYFSTFCMLYFLSRFDEIHTNRLHVAIAGALLQKKVLFSANNYFKCRAVYEFSIREHFPNVTWVD
ncbi:MAG: polysaccharide pyruvyl transferase family protein [Minisyncoccia bacterium]